MESSPDTTPAADRRNLERTPTALRAKVYPGGSDCVIKDFNMRGARVHFPGDPPADDRIVIVIWATGLALEAVRRWRGGSDAGFQFLSRVDLRGTVPERFAEAKAEWRKRRRKLRRGELKTGSAMVDYRGTPRAVHLS